MALNSADHRPHRPKAPPANGKRVLIVDDNHDIADCLAMLFKALGHLPRACHSGQACLECVDEFQPDLIFLDLNMPLLDGFETCRQIRARNGHRNIPVIACTALAKETVAHRLEDCGFDAYVRKPANMPQLEAIIAEAMSRRVRD